MQQRQEIQILLQAIQVTHWRLLTFAKVEKQVIKFSIRGILIATCLIAMGVLVWTSHNAIQVTKEKIPQLKSQKTLAAAKAASSRARQIHEKAEMDHLHHVASLVSELQSAFVPLQQKYGTIQPKDEKTLSIVRYPMLCDPKTSSTQVRLRILVPNERTVFLKFAIGLDEHDVQQPDNGLRWNERREYKWLNSSSYSRSGPFELRLPSGDCFVEWSFEKGDKQFQLELNDDPLLSTELLGLQTTGFSYSYLTFNQGGYYGAPSTSAQQLNFSPTDQLPKIIEFEHPSTDSGLGIGASRGRTQGTEVIDAAKKTVVHLRARVWLDEKSSGFESFPRVAK